MELHFIFWDKEPVPLASPDQLVLVEALSTSSKNKIRTVEEMSIISTFDDNMEAWKGYKRVHKENPEKELYVFHTSKEKPEVIEKFVIGVRGRKWS